jgi:hypothetical protein
MSIEAEGDGDITYQWLKDGIEQKKHNSKTLLIEKVSSSHSGTYRCVVKNEGKTVVSEAAVLDVIGTISIKRPKNKEQWKIGSIKKIQWECDDASIERVDLWFSKDGGREYQIIRRNVDNSKGELQWKVPDVISSYCKIRISNSDNEQIDDETEGFFYINTYDIPIRHFRNKSKLFSPDQFQIFPNPVTKGIDQSVFFVLNSPVKIMEREIIIYDALGNKIALMPGAQLIQENNQCNLGSWNLLNRSHEKITNGAYLAVLTITDTKGNKHILTKLIGIYDQPK